MPGITLYTGNCLEALGEKLAEIVSGPLPSPFTAEIVVVQSAGMQRWLSMELAARLGVWANCRYLFPNVVIDKIFEDTLGERYDGRLFEREIPASIQPAVAPICGRRTRVARR